MSKPKVTARHLKALRAMIEGKSFRMKKEELEAWNKVGLITSRWFTINAISCDGDITVCGNNHEIIENISMDSLVGL